MLLRSRLPSLFLLLLLIAPPLAAQTAAGLPPAVVEKIEKAVTAEMARQTIPGLSVAVVTANTLRWSNGYGMADLENFVPARAGTVYRLGSVSKPITAVAVMRLAEDGKLDLDAPIQKYVPDFPQKPWPVTSRQLLGHLGGIRHYGSPAEFDSTRHYTQLSDTLALFKNDPLAHEPGTKFLYTTYGYNVLGAMIEGASGKTYLEYLRENISAPAGLTTLRADDAFAIIPGRAQGYRKTAAGELRNSAFADTSNKIPGGGLCASAEDLARFAVAVQSGRLLRPQTLAQMFTAQQARDGTSTGYGLGWGVKERDGRKVVSHAGAQQRVRTLLYLLPEQRFAVALLCNLEGASLEGLAQSVADAVLGEKPVE